MRPRENIVPLEGTVPGIPQQELKEEAEQGGGAGEGGEGYHAKSRHLALGTQLEQLVPLFCNCTGHWGLGTPRFDSVCFQATSSSFSVLSEPQFLHL